MPIDESLRQFAEWGSENGGRLAKIEHIAHDALMHVNVICNAIDDPNGRRVRDLVRSVHRLQDALAELDEMPTTTRRETIN